jgi:hypothetical protein
MLAASPRLASTEDTMTSSETDLQMAQRHVAQGAARVEDQTALVATLTQQGRDTTAAELLLSIMREALLVMRAHLADEQEWAAASSSAMARQNAREARAAASMPSGQDNARRAAGADLGTTATRQAAMLQPTSKTRMTQQQTLLEMAQRHVVEGEARVAHQTALVAELARDGHNTARADALLATLKNTLHLMRDVLARERAREARGRRPRSHRW